MFLFLQFHLTYAENSRYANRAARFIDAYQQGLTGEEAVWANRKYHGHRMLPPNILAEVKASVRTIATST